MDTASTNSDPATHPSHIAHFLSAVELLKESLLETLWPTRCVICDLPGDLLCSSCKRNLPYIDYWQACKQCGSEYGRILCCECNSMILSLREIDYYPLDGCISVFRFNPTSKRIITLYKDRNEKRLSTHLAYLLNDIILPEWKNRSVLCPIPARASSKRKRGFDHIATIVQELSELSGIPSCSLLGTFEGGDQRNLDAKQRLKNMEHSFYLDSSIGKIPEQIILIDDVITTGSTLYAAAKILRKEGATHIFAATLARA